MQYAYWAFPSNDPAINALRRKVRHGSEANHPELVRIWLDAEDAHLTEHSPEQRWQLQCAIFKLLLDTFADDLVPSHWRCLCLDHLYLPLGELSRRANSGTQQQQLRELRHEMRVTSQYFNPANSRPTTTTRKHAT